MTFQRIVALRHGRRPADHGLVTTSAPMSFSAMSCRASKTVASGEIDQIWAPFPASDRPASALLSFTRPGQLKG